MRRTEHKNKSFDSTIVAAKERFVDLSYMTARNEFTALHSAVCPPEERKGVAKCLHESPPDFIDCCLACLKG
jgi:hypothetical protein